MIRGTAREAASEAAREAEVARRSLQAREEKDEARRRVAAAASCDAEEAAAAAVARKELRRGAEEELYSRATMVAKHMKAVQFDMYHRHKRMYGGGTAAAVEAFESATQRAAEWPGNVPSQDELCL